MKLQSFLIPCLLLASLSPGLSQEPPARITPAPDRRTGEGEGPFDRLVIRGITVIDGTGAPPRGPVDIVVNGNRIAEVKSVGAPRVPIEDRGRPAKGAKEIDGSGMYLLPGFVDLHVHTGGAPKAPDAEYALKLWMGHGVTTVRGVPAGGMDWTLNERARSAKNQTVAPRIFAYHRPFTGEGWKDQPVRTPETAREWVRFAAKKGVDGLKLGAMDPEIMAALLDEARKLHLGSTAHLDQMGVARMNARDAVRLGLGTVTHYYGLFEALLKDSSIQPYPVDQNYNDEQHRFGQVARLWDKIHPRGSKEWNALIDELAERRAVLDPTMVAYLAGRDVMRMRQAEWHPRYALPSMWDFYQPSRTNHGSFYYNWTTEDEYQWKNFYRVWMSLINDFKNRGGRVSVGSDSGFIYNLYGFGYVQEMELLREAGFHPLEVIRSATLYGAQALHEPKGKPIEFGIVRPGLLADLVIVDQNPIENLKVLFGTGAVRLNDQTGRAERVGGVRYTIKDGIIYDAKKLLADVAAMVERAKSSPSSSRD
ncbi:MAG: amidohydrolase family protein [Bryobacteraceae bacterium]